MNQFNHKYKDLPDAVGITQERARELTGLTEKAWNTSRCMSERMEKVLENGLNVIEVMYCGYLLGMVEQMTRHTCTAGEIVLRSSLEDLRREEEDE